MTANTFAVVLTTAAAIAWGVWLGRAPERAYKLRPALIAITIALLGFWLWQTVGAREDVNQGIVQKIFYVHIPAIIPTYLGFAITAICGGMFLQSRDERWDHVARAGAELGVLFCTLMLLVGPIWAKPTWGYWWAWDLRLTLTLVLWFIYVAYLFLRSLSRGSDTARTFASVYGIVGTVAIPFVYKAVDLARGSTMHPDNPAKEGLPADMALAVSAGMVAFVFLFATWLGYRSEILALEHAEELRLAESGPLEAEEATS